MAGSTRQVGRPPPGLSKAMNENDISRHIVDSAIEVHRTLGGPGLLESVYEEALVWELEHRKLDVRRQAAVPIAYKGSTLASTLRIDLIVAGLVIVECKATNQIPLTLRSSDAHLPPIDRAQTGAGHQLRREGRQGRHPSRSERPLTPNRPIPFQEGQTGRLIVWTMTKCTRMNTWAPRRETARLKDEETQEANAPFFASLGLGVFAF